MSPIRNDAACGEREPSPENPLHTLTGKLKTAEQGEKILAS